MSHVWVTSPAGVLQVLVIVSLTLHLGVASRKEQQGVEVVGEAHGYAAHHEACVVQEQSVKKKVRKESPWP